MNLVQQVSLIYLSFRAYLVHSSRSRTFDTVEAFSFVVKTCPKPRSRPTSSVLLRRLEMRVSLKICIWKRSRCSSRAKPQAASITTPLEPLACKCKLHSESNSIDQRALRRCVFSPRIRPVCCSIMNPSRESSCIADSRQLSSGGVKLQQLTSCLMSALRLWQ